MHIGILADIHEHVGHLKSALTALRARRVDRIVMLGDVIETGAHIDQTVKLLRDAGATGVWGNHDLGLSHEPEPRVVKRFSANVRDYFAALTAKLEIDDLLFSHGLPTWDPTDPAAYYLSAKPWMEGALKPVFDAYAQSVIFVGHHHCWFAADQTGAIAWAEGEVMTLNLARRYLIVVHAVMDGWCATFDTSSRVLTPLRIGEGER